MLIPQVERHLHPVKLKPTGNVSALSMLMSPLLRSSADEVQVVITLK